MTEMNQDSREISCTRRNGRRSESETDQAEGRRGEKYRQEDRQKGYRPDIRKGRCKIQTGRQTEGNQTRQKEGEL